jgi:hypothetical protein
MATVSILLSLVLISGSVLSGIYARYVTKKDLLANDIGFRKFDVKIDVSAGKKWGTRTDGNNVIFTGAKFKPGDNGLSISSATANDGMFISLNFQNYSQDGNFIAKANVKTRIKLYFNFSVNTSSSGTFTVPAGTFSYISADTTIIPLGVSMYASYYLNKDSVLQETTPSDNTNNDLDNVSIVEPWKVCSTEEFSKAVLLGMISKMDFAQKDITANKVGTDDGLCKDSVGYFIYKDFDPGSNIVFYPKGDSTNYVNRIYLNFDYPFTWPPEDKDSTKYPTFTKTGYAYDVDKIDEISTYINSQNPTFDVLFRAVAVQYT